MKALAPQIHLYLNGMIGLSLGVLPEEEDLERLYRELIKLQNSYTKVVQRVERELTTVSIKQEKQRAQDEYVLSQELEED